MSSFLPGPFGDPRSSDVPKAGPLGWLNSPLGDSERATLGPHPLRRELPSGFDRLPHRRSVPTDRPAALYGLPTSRNPNDFRSLSDAVVPDPRRTDASGEIAPKAVPDIEPSPAGGVQPATQTWRLRQPSTQDPILIRAYAEQLLEKHAVLITDEQLAAMHLMLSDAPFQDAVSARQVSRVLTASGASFSRLLAEPDYVKAELGLISALKTDLVPTPRFAFASKETIDEAMRVFKAAHKRFSRERELPNDAQILSHYLRDSFPPGTDARVIARVVKAIIDTPQPGALRRVQHLVHLSARLQEQQSSLAALQMMPREAAELPAWRLLRDGDHGGVAAMETFYDWHNAFSNEQRPPVLSDSAPPLDPDKRAVEDAEEFAQQTFRKSLPETLAAATTKYGRARRHGVTMFYDASTEGVLDELIKIGALRVKSLGEKVWYIEFDIINLGGLNAFFMNDQTLADPYIRAICQFFVDCLSAHAKELVPFYIHGDEFGLVVTGMEEEDLIERLAEVQAKITAYTQETMLNDETRLADIERGKKTGQDGFGAHIGYARIKANSKTESLRKMAATMIDKSKKPETSNQ